MELAPGGARDPAMTRDQGQGAVPQWSWPPEGPETGPRVRGVEVGDQRRNGAGPRRGQRPTSKSRTVAALSGRNGAGPRRGQRQEHAREEHQRRDGQPQWSWPPEGPETARGEARRRRLACRNGAGPRRGQRHERQVPLSAGVPPAAMELAPGAARDERLADCSAAWSTTPQTRWTPEGPQTTSKTDR